MAKLKMIPSPATKKLEINTFYGADLTNQASFMSASRSPNCVNMIRQSAKKVQKWIGFKTVAHYPARINGVHIWVDEAGQKTLYHSGDKIYLDDEVIYQGADDARSVSKQLDGKLYIFDGLKLLVFYKEEQPKFETEENILAQTASDTPAEPPQEPTTETFVCKAAEEIAYIPTIFISKAPNGGGQPYQPINLLQDKKTESFLGTATDKVYQLAVTEIDSVDKVIKVTASGEEELKETTDYTVDKALGKITFTAPHPPVVTGEDSVKITYSKQIKGYKDRINTCCIATIYGVNAARDRLFCAGNPKLPNRDYYSQLNNGLYFGDVWYSVVGADNSQIMGYSFLNDKLATHLDRSDDDTNIVLRFGEMQDGEAAFRLSGSYQGSGAVSRYAFGVLETEPLYLTQNGVYAVTPSDILGERFAQLRSCYINGLLQKQDLKDACAVTFDRFYMLAAGEYIFALDGTQAFRENNEPYSNRQYAGFYRNNINARCIWTQNGSLMFGTQDGKVKQFHKDYTDILNFNDDGKPIVARWATPELTADDFYKKKRFKRIHLLLGSAPATSVKISAKYDGINEVIKENDAQARYFLYPRITYSKFTYKTDRTAQVISEKFLIKPQNKKLQLILENGEINEPLVLYQTVMEFNEW